MLWWITILPLRLLLERKNFTEITYEFHRNQFNFIEKRRKQNKSSRFKCSLDCSRLSCTFFICTALFLFDYCTFLSALFQTFLGWKKNWPHGARPDQVMFNCSTNSWPAQPTVRVVQRICHLLSYPDKAFTSFVTFFHCACVSKKILMHWKRRAHPNPLAAMKTSLHC
jgi:hypothetical protein